MDFISSLDTVSLSSDLFNPNIFINKFVEAERIFTNGVDILDGADRKHGNNDASYAYWEITGLKTGEHVIYAIRVGQDDYETWERFTFEVLPDPRNMKIVQDALIYNFDARGRSNSEAI